MGGCCGALSLDRDEQLTQPFGRLVQSIRLAVRHVEPDLLLKRRTALGQGDHRQLGRVELLLESLLVLISESGLEVVALLLVVHIFTEKCF